MLHQISAVFRTVLCIKLERICILGFTFLWRKTTLVTVLCLLWCLFNFCCILSISICLLQDHVLIELTQTGMKGQDDLVREEDPYVVVHPNYVIDVWTGQHIPQTSCSSWLQIKHCFTWCTFQTSKSDRPVCYACLANICSWLPEVCVNLGKSFEFCDEIVMSKMTLNLTILSVFKTIRYLIFAICIIWRCWWNFYVYLFLFNVSWSRNIF